MASLLRTLMFRYILPNLHNLGTFSQMASPWWALDLLISHSRSAQLGHTQPDGLVMVGPEPSTTRSIQLMHIWPNDLTVAGFDLPLSPSQFIQLWYIWSDGLVVASLI